MLIGRFQSPQTRLHAHCNVVSPNFLAIPTQASLYRSVFSLAPSQGLNISGPLPIKLLDPHAEPSQSHARTAGVDSQMYLPGPSCKHSQCHVR